MESLWDGNDGSKHDVDEISKLFAYQEAME